MDRLKALWRDRRGIVTVEAALLLTLLVLPVGLAVARYSGPAVEWVKVTSTNLKRNSELQEENNALLKELLARPQTAPQS